jgi:hypothetical protein
MNWCRLGTPELSTVYKQFRAQCPHKLCTILIRITRSLALEAFSDKGVEDAIMTLLEYKVRSVSQLREKANTILPKLATAWRRLAENRLARQARRTNAGRISEH